MPHHIVIVEDEPVTQARLQSYFTQEGYTVSVTASGAGLREIMQNQPGGFDSAGYQFAR